MHLTCALHERRVVTISGKAVHRSTIEGELSPKCATKVVRLNGKKFPVDAEHFGKNQPDPAEVLIKEIFGEQKV